MANNAIGILFEVQGGGDISGESGKRINGQLRNLVGQINKSDTVKLKFQIDSNYFNQQIKQLQQQLQSLSASAGGSAGGGGKGSAQTSQTQQQTKAFRDAAASVTNYYNLLTQLQNAMTRTTAIVGSQTEGFRLSEQATARETERWSELITQVNQAREAYTNATSTQNASSMTAEQYATVLERSAAAQMKFNLQSATATSNAQSAWGNLTAKVHDYVSRVEYSASRNKFAAQSLKELREMANSTDYRGYDALKQKLAEVQKYINENALATETWGQKMLKTFGSRVRSALAGIVTAKIGQYLRDIYNNVVELDTAITNLQIASGKNREEVERLTKSYSKLAQQLGATTIEVANAADTWLRQGYAAEEANILITNSTMLSKLGQIEAAEASTALTSAMKGYKVSVADSVKIVDKLTAVDMEAAASAGGIAKAMAETATSAKIAGVSMDTLIGYIATVKEVTQDGDESVGTFFKTLFARMNNVAAGNFVDEETGESLNDVETVLNELGIALRDANGEFRSSASVLSEVSERWESFDSVQQHAIATAMSGTRQQEKFIVLMDNYSNAMKYAETATNSAGTAVEKYSVYTDSIEGKLNSLSSTFEEFSMTVLNSEVVAGAVDFLKGVLTVLNAILSFGDGFVANVALVLVSTGLLTAALYKLTTSAILSKLSITNLTIALSSMSSTGIVGVLTLIPKLIVFLASLCTATGRAQLATFGLKGALEALNINPVMLVITAIVAAGAAAIAIANKVDTAWEDAYESAKENAEKQKELIAEYDSEIESLESLQEKLEDAHGSRQKLANLYSELNAKVATSTGLLAGEEEAYQAVNAQIEDQIKAMRALKEEALGAKIAEERAAFDAQKGKRTGGIWNWDWVKADASGEDMRSLMYGDTSDWDYQKYVEMGMGALNSGSHGIDPEEAGKYLNYEVFYEVLTQDEQKNLLGWMGFTEDSWKSYWDAQVNTANEVFADVINNSSGTFNTSFMQSVVDRLIRGGYTLEQTSDVLSDLTNGSEELTQKISEYYTALAKDDGTADGIYDELMSIFDGYIEKYPELTKIFSTLIGSIRTADTVQTAFTVELETLSDMLEETGGAYDALTAAMQDMQETGALTSNTIQKIISDFPELLEYLEETSEGFIVADGAMSKFLADTRASYLVNVTKAQEAYQIAYEAYESSDKKTEEDRRAVEAAQESLQNAIENANNWLRSEAVLTRSTIFEEYTNLLKEQQKSIEDEYDSYKELCELRKDLLRTYQEELDYKKKLKAAQDNVSRLSTKLAISQLDTSAAGQARTRELRAELQDAEDELDDITLEHAIELLENQLESQMVQYENFIQNQIQQIEQTIRDAVNMSTNELAAALEKAGGSSASSNSAAGTGTANDGTSVSTDNSSYNSTVNNAQSYLDSNSTISGSNYKEPTAEEKMAADIVQFGDASGRGMNAGKTGDNGIITWNGKEYEVENKGSQGSGTTLWKAAVNVKKFKDRQIFGYGGNVYGYLDGQIQKIGGRYWSQTGYNNFVDAVKAQYGTYHTGGLVGGISTLTSSEEFAKLLKGEFVSTPEQMKRFMEETLPAIANYQTSGGNNEFNAPLIELICESVTSESLPELESIVNEAVKEIKKLLDSGMSRTGYKRSVKPI